MKKLAKKVSVKRSKNHQGLDGDFIIIAGGGFVLLAVMFMLLVH